MNLAASPPSSLVPPPPDMPPPPPSVSVAPVSLPAEKDEIAMAIAVAPKALLGQQAVIISGVMNTGKESVTRTLPAIAVRIIAAKQP